MTITNCSSFALFDDATWPDRPAVLFIDPIDLVEAHTPDQVYAAIAKLDELRANGMFVAGYFAYELGYLFEQRLRSLLPSDHGTLLRFHAFARPQYLSATECVRWLLEQTKGRALSSVTVGADPFHCYAPRFDIVHDLIERGDVYQVNLTTRRRLNAEGDLFATYLDLRERARAGACSFVCFPGEAVLSFSPETFFTVKDRIIKTRPMKGTIARRPRSEDDLIQIEALRADPKQRAENLMIVDLMRNDLSRICEVGSVRVSDMFTAETYPTFHTLTSGVEGTLKAAPTFDALLPALFPCGSVTGAPKIRAMEIIREVEPSPRGVYCGAIGFSSRERMNFNVAIRTLSVKADEGVLGVGGGIVWDSNAQSEFDECELKAKFFTTHSSPMRLLETMRWTPEDAFLLLERHLLRLRTSAAYFGFKLDEVALRARLLELAQGLEERSIIRLTLGVRGDSQIEVRSLEPAKPDDAWKFVVCENPVNAEDVRLHHKTTRREVYDERIADCRIREVFDELVLVNERGEVTEGTRSNIFVERDGVLHTPPLACGLLNGCLRTELLASRARRVVETVLLPKDLRPGTVWFGNSVRGLVRGVFAGTVASDFGCATLPDR